MAARNPTDREVRALARQPGMHRVRAGLYLRVRETGAAFWMLRYTQQGRAREMSFGPYSTLSLMEAAAQAQAWRLKLKRDGIDPIDQRRTQQQRARGATFKDVAQALIEAKRAGWKNAKHAAQWGATLEAYAFPRLAARDVAAITTEDVLSVLTPIWTDKHETATRVRQRIEAVIDAGTARGLRHDANPARWKGHLDKLLAAIPKSQRTEHHAALPWRELPGFMQTLRQRDSISARALEFTILTACRTGEVLGALWDEIDLENAVWTVPGVRMKAKREHRVALSGDAVALLSGLPRIAGEPLVFPGAKAGKPLSSMAMLELLRGMRPGLTVHGFRSTFRDWVADATRFSPEVAEMALAHVIANQTEAAYRRGDLLERRRELMKAWAQSMREATGGSVVAMPGRGAA